MKIDWNRKTCRPVQKVTHPKSILSCDTNIGSFGGSFFVDDFPAIRYNIFIYE